MTSIRIENLEKRFGSLRAVKNVNVNVAESELFTLLGPSGCGKTTLLRTVAGFYRQDQGDIYLGKELINDVPPYKRDTGMVFQNYAVFPHLTVFENVAFGLHNRKVASAEIAERVTKALKMCRLSGYDKRTPDQLSGGQQQRVGLARAMVIEPRVLLLDEPLSNLDAKLRVEMRDEIRDIQRQLGITALYVTHDQEEALVISDRIAVMEAGVIRQVGKPWEIYKSPEDLFVANFVGHMNFIEGEVVSRDGKKFLRADGCELALGPSVPDRPRLKIAFRPEEAAFTSAPGSAVITGKVEKTTFIGTLAVYTIPLAEGTAVTIERHRPTAADIFAPGTPVTLSVPFEAMLFFDPETGGRLRAEGGGEPMNLKARPNFWTAVTFLGYLTVVLFLIYPLFNIFRYSFIDKVTGDYSLVNYATFLGKA